MGTDIYLVWNNQSEEEKERQCTGYSIDAGNSGYLRASIGMTTENYLLRVLFPDHWEGDEPKPFDFTNPDNKKRLNACAVAYLVTVLTGKQVSHEKHKKAEKFGQELATVLEKMGIGKAVSNGEMDLRSAIMWLNSLYNFYELGRKKQKEGGNPAILISW